MTEVLFYHLTENTLEQTLPGLLERSLERGWRAAIQTVSEEKRDALDEHLWTYKDQSFLAHAVEGVAKMKPEEQPIWLTTSDDNPSKADIRFAVEGAVPSGIDEYDRVIYIFDGLDEEAVADARKRWKVEKEAGHDLTYWQQDHEGRWSKKA